MKTEVIIEEGLTTTIMTQVIGEIKNVVYRFVNTDCDSIYYGCCDIEIYQYNAITNELLSFERR